MFLELWEIDTFEGGTNSRAKFLEKEAIQYQKKNNGIYIIVHNITLEQCVTMLGEDRVPDLISFGIGAGDVVCAYTQKLNVSNNIRKPLLNAGQVAGVQYAMPWCMGGYVVCAKTVSPSTYGVGMEYNVAPQISADTLKKYKSQYEAYKAFCNNEVDALLGTQRDYYRLTNKLNLGVISQCEFKYNNEYSDLVQYLSITTTNDKFLPYAQDFLEYIIGQQVQEKLKDIGMFSVVNKPIYANTPCADFELNVMSVNDVLNVFSSNERITELQTNL